MTSKILMALRFIKNRLAQWAVPVAKIMSSLALCSLLVLISLSAFGLDLRNGGNAGGTSIYTKLSHLYSFQTAKKIYARAFTPSLFLSTFKLQQNQQDGHYGVGETIAFFEKSSFSFKSYEQFCQTFSRHDKRLEQPNDPIVFVGQEGRQISSKALTAYTKKYGQRGIAETMMDVEWAHVVAPQARLLVIDIDNMSTAKLKEVLSKYHPNVVSNSLTTKLWRFPTFLGSYQWTAANYPFFTSSGDDGSYVAPLTVFPKAVIVGGTRMNPWTDNYTLAESEIWPGEGAGTAFFSAFALPYQKSKTTPWRVVPDVVWLAGYPGVLETVPYKSTSKWIDEEGTSLAAPLWSAMWALADNAHRAGTGQKLPNDANQVLYRLSHSTPRAFSITSSQGAWGLGQPSSSFVKDAATFKNSSVKIYPDYYPYTLAGYVEGFVVLGLLGIWIYSLVRSERKRELDPQYKYSSVVSWSSGYLAAAIVAFMIGAVSNGLNDLPLAIGKFPFRLVSASVLILLLSGLSIMVKRAFDHIQYKEWKKWAEKQSKFSVGPGATSK